MLRLPHFRLTLRSDREHAGLKDESEDDFFKILLGGTDGLAVALGPLPWYRGAGPSEGLLLKLALRTKARRYRSLSLLLCLAGLVGVRDDETLNGCPLGCESGSQNSSVPGMVGIGGTGGTIPSGSFGSGAIGQDPGVPLHDMLV